MKILIAAIVGLGILVGLVFFFTVVDLGVERIRVEGQREINTQSQQYVQTTIEQLYNLKDDYDSLELKVAEGSITKEFATNQQSYIKKQMRNKASQIDAYLIPQEIVDLIGN